MIMWEGIKKSMNYHHHHYSIWSQRYQYFQSFLWGWRGKRRRRGLSPEGSPLCRALQGKYDDYILKTFKNPKSWFFMTWISWLVFIAWNLCFTVFWLVLMAPHFCEFGNYISRKNVSDIKKMQWRRFPH